MPRRPIRPENTMIVLDEHLKPTGLRISFANSRDAAGFILQSATIIYQILHPSHPRKTTTNKRKGETVTFVKIDATEEEILEWLQEIQNEKGQ